MRTVGVAYEPLLSRFAVHHGSDSADATTPLRVTLHATGTPSLATGVSTTDALLYGARWEGVIRYSFPDGSIDYEVGYEEASNGFAPVSVSQMQAARYILEGRSAYSGGPKAALTPVEGFTLATFVDAGFDESDIRIAQSKSGGPTAYAYLPSTDPAGGDIWFGRTYDYTRPELGTYSFATMMHELGHSLGLKHAHETGGLTGDALPVGRDSLEYSVMTYHSYVPFSDQAAPSAYTNETYGYPQTFMMYDIAALQSLYGADFGFRSGNTVYRWSPQTGETFVDGVGMGAPGAGRGEGANRIFLTIWDGGGSDTYDFSGYSSKVSVNLAPGGASSLASGQRAYLGDGHYARGNVFNALQYQGDSRSLIENAVGGSGHDVIKGNAIANRLRGSAGNDILSGLNGNDVLAGGIGADSFLFASAPDASTNIDRITDFDVADDTIRLDDAVFTAFARKGVMTSAAFHLGGAAHDSSDRVIYNKFTGALLYDPDGTGAAGAIKFAQLSSSLRLRADDFLIV
jgi:serralysin